ncbi:Membrane-bound lytic murein transglycosylase B [Actinopolyspora lacussalsi subsp. righensis]|uniref:Membrane-bound lytic murein transglycosylase B n=1 Tax=Actinopolyspora righensis TaxID=995060 RepID=A0A1I7B8I4_9ACTN|nr:lytic transglycosylase domain-containing protein [Actinopolyspora righensis]SFT83441.1 Membrane-bound lytic murein transglycosylase B [Actinopolyspora righensis]
MTESASSKHPRSRSVSRAVLAVAGRGVLAVGTVASTVLGVGAVAVFGEPSAAPQAPPLARQSVEPAPVEPGSSAPGRSGTASEPGDESGEDPVRDWANEVAAVVDVPSRALVSYVNADLAMRSRSPECGVDWATLAGIGRVESDHGRYNGRRLGADAVPSSPIIGVPLDGGEDVRAITDTDDGVLDGDTVHDRAVGPMQFIPSTWAKWSTDGSGDGVGDPHNLDDAAMAAARYLCAGGRDMRSGDGWWSGVMSYNNSVSYARKVFSLAERYAQAGSRDE